MKAAGKLGRRRVNSSQEDLPWQGVRRLHRVSVNNRCCFIFTALFVCVRVRACMQVATVRLWLVVDNFKERAKLREKAAAVIFCDLILTQSGAQRSKPGTGPVS